MDPSPIIGMLMVLVMWSSLYKENPLYLIGENMLVGVSMGYFFVIAYNFIQTSCIKPMIAGSYYLVIAVVLGLMLFFNLHKKYSWVSRYPMWFIMGTSAALAMTGAIKAQITDQIRATILPVLSISSPMDIFNSIITLVLVIAGIMYFIFTREVKGPIRHVRTVGYWLLIITFGVLFGSTVLYRVDFFLGQLNKVLKPEIRPCTLLSAILILVVVKLWSRWQEQKGVVDE